MFYWILILSCHKINLINLLNLRPESVLELSHITMNEYTCQNFEPDLIAGFKYNIINGTRTLPLHLEASGVDEENRQVHPRSSVKYS